MLNREPFSLLSPSLSASVLDRAPLALKPYDASIHHHHRPSIVVPDPERTNVSDERVSPRVSPRVSRVSRASLTHSDATHSLGHHRHHRRHARRVHRRVLGRRSLSLARAALLRARVLVTLGRLLLGVSRRADGERHRRTDRRERHGCVCSIRAGGDPRAVCRRPASPARRRRPGRTTGSSRIFIRLIRPIDTHDSPRTVARRYIP